MTRMMDYLNLKSHRLTQTQYGRLTVDQKLSESQVSKIKPNTV